MVWDFIVCYIVYYFNDLFLGEVVLGSDVVVV